MIQKSIGLILIFSYFLGTGNSRQLFVSSATGDDHHDGTTMALALKTLQYAANMSQPGDTINIAQGIYRSGQKNLLRISQNGTVDHWIYYKAYGQERPILYISNESAISFNLASYIQIEGLEITQDPEYISRFSNFDQKDNITSKGNGILFERSRNEGYLSHHIRLKNNFIHDCPGTAIDVNSADYLDFVFNTIQANGNLSSNNNCGIRMQFLSAFDQKPGDHIQIMYNSISDHRQQGALARINNTCEESYGGAGIAMRNNRFDPYQANRPAYQHGILISNNIIYLNGGPGIDIFETNNLSLINNTLYQNNQNNESRCGEIVIDKTKGVRAYNNIIAARLGLPGSAVNNYEGVSFKNNLYANTKIYFKGEKDLNEDPLFTTTDHHLGQYNFELRPKSSAINTGFNELLSPYDFQGNIRLINGRVDMGAIEYSGSLPKPRDHEQAKVDRRHITVTWQYSYAQTTGQIIILNSKGERFCARLYNNTGKLLAQEMNIDGSRRGVEFDVSGYPSGLYFVVSYSDTEKISTRYFVQNQFAGRGR
ncbi:MAG: right-handed parallel beta-helix repeat-containing protein [Saprospiraceae bacterium]